MTRTEGNNYTNTTSQFDKKVNRTPQNSNSIKGIVTHNIKQLINGLSVKDVKAGFNNYEIKDLFTNNKPDICFPKENHPQKCNNNLTHIKEGTKNNQLSHTNNTNIHNDSEKNCLSDKL